MALAKRAQDSQAERDNPDFKWDFDKLNQQWDEFCKEMAAIDKLAGPGLQVGRTLSFSVADGQACYIITKIRKNDVVVEWIPMVDSYFSDAVSLTPDQTKWVVNRLKAEQRCGFEDAWDRAGKR